MNNRVNKKIPYEKDGVAINSKLDELMMQYYRVPMGDGESALHIEAFEVGQKLQYYFAVYSVAIVNQIVDGSKMQAPSLDYTIEGLEAPLVLMLDNPFFQHNFQVIISSILAEITRMNTSRMKSEEEQVLAYSLSLCKWEYLSTIAGLVAGSKAQKAMDIELREAIVADMDMALESVRKHRESLG